MKIECGRFSFDGSKEINSLQVDQNVLDYKISFDMASNKQSGEIDCGENDL